MTRKDYFLIAKAIKEAFDGKEVIKKETLLKTLIPLMREDNPNFQQFRFLLGCDFDDAKRSFE